MASAKQYVAYEAGIQPTLELIPPMVDEFSVYGTMDAVERARTWALANHFLLIRGVPACAHGLYMMSCPMARCSGYGWYDHVNLWCSAEGPPEPFLLAAPYDNEIRQSAFDYAEAHGLNIWDKEHLNAFGEGLNWYGEHTIPIRMAITEDAVWPIEPRIVWLREVCPFEWPDWED